MQLAPVARMAPMRIAETLLEHLEPPASIAEVSIAPPGFLNIRLDPGLDGGQVGPIREPGWRTAARRRRRHRVNVEFVAPTPPGR